MFLAVPNRLYAKEVVLAEGGKASCAIVTGAEDGLSLTYSLLIPKGNTQVVPTGVLREAADDLAKYLNHMMGGKGAPADLVKVVSDKAQTNTKFRILLGSAAIEEYGLQAEAQTLSYSGYMYRTQGNDLLIFGKRFCQCGNNGSFSGHKSRFLFPRFPVR